MLKNLELFYKQSMEFFIDRWSRLKELAEEREIKRQEKLEALERLIDEAETDLEDLERELASIEDCPDGSCRIHKT